MPIYEYLCDTCGNKFEKLVRRSDGDMLEAGCPSCSGVSHKQDYSRFAAHASAGGASASEGACGMGQSFGCGGGMCGAPGMCSRN